jgi:uncharacterized protein YeaO (DUF488 family)
MALFSKSIQAKKESSDGIRICIMRRPGEGLEWDVWMPTLSPSHELLNSYHEGTTSWEEYEVRFENEVLQPNQEYIKMVCELAHNRDITLLCWEETPEKCHRRLVLEACQKHDRDLEIVVK